MSNEDEYEKTVVLKRPAAGGAQPSAGASKASNEGEHEKTVVLKRAPAPSAPAAPRIKLECLDDTYVSDKEHALEIKLSGTEQIVGRGEESSLRIDSPVVSRRHARFFVQGTAWAIEDLGSKNGIFVNKSRVKRAVLKPGDRIDIGQIPFLVALDEDEGGKAAGDKQAFEQTVIIGKRTKQPRPGSSVEETLEMRSVRRQKPAPRPLWPLLVGVAAVLVILFFLIT